MRSLGKSPIACQSHPTLALLQQPKTQNPKPKTQNPTTNHSQPTSQLHPGRSRTATSQQPTIDLVDIATTNTFVSHPVQLDSE
jgi:hypothetical protein